MTFVFTAAFLLAGPPRFLGPPEKKPPEGDAAAVAAGDAAPLFSGVVKNVDLAGVERVDLAALVGPRAGARQAKAVLISFFGASCEACRKELAVLQTLYAQYRERGLRVLSVAVDPGELLRRVPVEYPVIEDRNGRITRRYLGPKMLFPSAVIVDREGKVVVAKKGYPDDPAIFLRAQVENALR